MKRMLERELKVLGVAERAVERITCTMCFLGMAFWFPTLFYLGRVQWETAPNKLRGGRKQNGPMSSKFEQVCVGLGLAVARNGDSCSGYAGFRPCLLSTGPPCETQKRV